MLLDDGTPFISSTECNMYQVNSRNNTKQTTRFESSNLTLGKQADNFLTSPKETHDTIRMPTEDNQISSTN